MLKNTSKISFQHAFSILEHGSLIDFFFHTDLLFLNTDNIFTTFIIFYVNWIYIKKYTIAYTIVMHILKVKYVYILKASLYFKMQRSSSFNQNFNQKSLEHKANIPRSSSLNFNQTFINLDNLSRILEEPEFDTWTNIYGLVISKPVLKRIFNYRLPNSYFCSSKSNVYCNLKCNFHHFMYQKYKILLHLC